MSNYGSYPGPPPERWPGQGPQEPYTQPADPWGGGADPWGGTPSSTPPAGAPTSDPGYPGYPQGGYDQGGYPAPGYDPNYSSGYGATRQYEPGQAQAAPPQTAWVDPVAVGAPPRRRGNGGLIAIIVVLAVLVVGGGVAAVWKLGGDGTDPVAQESPEPTVDASSPADSSPAPESSTDARFVKKGECVVNEGSDQDPKLKIVECGAKTFEVLARFDGTVDYETKCKTVDGYQFHYFFDSELNPLDFVLCLKQR